MITQNYLTLSQAANSLQQKTQRASVWRWCRYGLKSVNGQKIYLKHYRIGREILTTQEDLDNFFKYLAQADMEHFGKDKPKPARRIIPPKPNKKAQEQAENELRASGILKPHKGHIPSQKSTNAPHKGEQVDG